MDKFNIAMFIGQALSNNDTVTPEYIQKYIRFSPFSGSIIPIERIKETLDDLTLSGWLDVLGGMDFNTCYKKYSGIDNNIKN